MTHMRLHPLVKRWLWIVPLLLAVLAFAPAPWGDLVRDDRFFLDRQLIVFKTIGDVVFPPGDMAGWANLYYRPVAILSYLIQVEIFGKDATVGPHVFNVIMHAATTFFVWLLARRLLAPMPNSGLGALVAAALFAVHPIHAESVNWIAGRTDMLAALFYDSFSDPGAQMARYRRFVDTGCRCATLFFFTVIQRGRLGRSVSRPGHADICAAHRRCLGRVVRYA